MTYKGRQQATVSQWVALLPIFEVCKGEKGYEGGERRREAWWRQDATVNQLWSTLEGVSYEAKRRRQQEERFTQ